MPGLVGIVANPEWPQSAAEQQLSIMVNAVRHDPCYTKGTWRDIALGVYVGWSSLTRSDGRRVPVLCETNGVSVLFSGEELSRHHVLMDGGKKEGADPHDRLGPFARLYEEDPSFPAGLNGRFHGIVADRRHGTSMLFNDRYGMHRLFWSQAADAFYFATEAKAILAVLPELRRVDPRGLGEFFACGCVLEDRTIFNGISALPPGSAWVFRGGSCECRTRYFDEREWAEQEPVGMKEYVDQVREAVAASLPEYFYGPEDVGIALTGGLDTRVILAMQKPEPGTLPCYTFGGAIRESRDVRVARTIARLCGQSHTVITVGSEFLSRFGEYAKRTVFLTEGGAEVSRAADLYLSERAREIAPVKIVGTFGSEVLRNAVMFKPSPLEPCLLAPETRPLVDAASATYGSLRKQDPRVFAAFRQAPYYHHGVLALEESQLTVRTPYLDNAFVKAAFRAPRTLEDIRFRLVAGANPQLALVPTDFGCRYPPGMLGALSHQVHMFTHRAEYACDYGMPQWLCQMDRLMSPLRLEKLLLGRHKFCHFRTWYRNELSEFVCGVLLDARALSRPYLRSEGLLRILGEHQSGRRNHTAAIHKLLTLELLHQQFIDGG
jgi:asparagine synthase (glutamine-hydrolysing)